MRKNNFLLFMLISGFFLIVSCNNVSNNTPLESTIDTPVITGNSTISMFVPDYKKMAEDARAVAPQTKFAKLSYLQDEEWICADLLVVDMDSLEEIENAPEDMPGKIWKGTFGGIPLGIYEAGKLKIELLDKDQTIISSGINNTSVEIKSAASTSTSFFALPNETIEIGKDNFVRQDCMEFLSVIIQKDNSYTIDIAPSFFSTEYPDVAIFNADGTFEKCVKIDTAEEASIKFEKSDKTEIKYLGFYSTNRTVGFTASVTMRCSTFYEDFEADTLRSKYNWSGSASITSVSKLEAEKYAYEGVTDNFATQAGLELILILDIVEQSALSFKHIQSASLLVDEQEHIFAMKNENCWRSETVIIPAGKHTLKFSSYFAIDNISLAPDVVAGVKVTPRAKQQTYIGCKDYEKIVAKGYAVRSDGSMKEDAEVTLTATGGTIDENGVFTPNAEGTAKITATCGEFTAESGDITVYSADYMQKPFTYNGKTYQGITEESGDDVVNLDFADYRTSDHKKVTITYPSKTTITADGFMALEGTIEDAVAANRNTAMIKIVKADDSTLETNYIVRDTFSERLWLRFGAGEYKVTVYPCIGKNNPAWREYTDADGNKCEGLQYRYGDISDDYCIKFTVTNTREESAGGESDGRWIYPSYICQADNFLVTNTVDEAVYGLPDNATDTQKMKAIHDYMVRTKYYDYVSFNHEAQHKKMDAVSVLRNGTCVCEGYTNTTAAMARYVGIPAKYIASTPMNHAWNNIYIDGAWKFLDVTWDDPSKDGNDADVDPQPYRVRYTYFLLDTLNGVDGDHYSDIENKTRSVIAVPTIPEWKGTPGGWY